MRLFIAIEFNKTIHKALTDIQRIIRFQGVTGRFTRDENLHLTLAFIGDYPDPDQVLECMESVPFTPFDISLEGFGHFGDLYWTGIRKSDALEAYVKRLRHVLADEGIPFDRKKFSPHITLVRRASFVREPAVVIPPASMTVDHITLFRSDFANSGMIYTEIGNVSGQ